MACSSSCDEGMIDVLPLYTETLKRKIVCRSTLFSEAFKEEGDIEYRKGEYNYATVCYTLGINYNCGNENCDDSTNVNAKLFTNRATAHLQLGHYQEALRDAESGRKLQPTYMKAIETGASACVKLILFEKAITWCDEGLAIEPDNKTLQKLRSISLKAKHSCTDKVKDASKTGTLKVDQTNQQNVSLEISPLVADNLLDTVNETDVIPPPAQTLEFDDDTLRAIADVYNKEGCDEYRKGEYVNAIDFYTEGIKVGCQDKNLSAALFINRATVHFQLGNYHEALRNAEVARKFQPTNPEVIATVAILGSLACLQLYQYLEAITWCDEGLAIDQENMCLCELRKYLVTAINISWSSKSRTEQEYKWEHGEEINDKSCDKTIKELVYCRLGGKYIYGGHYKKALKYSKLYLSFAEDRGDKQEQGHAYDHLGHIYMSLGDLKTAMEYYKQRLSIAEDAGDKRSQASAYFHLASIHLSRRDFRTAMEYGEQSLSFAKDTGDKRSQAAAYCQLGSVHRRLGSLEKAIEYFQLSLSIANDIEDKEEQARAYQRLGVCYACQGDLNTALEYYQKFLSFSKDSGNKEDQALAHSGLGRLYKGLGDLSKAEDCLKSSLDLYDSMRDLLHSRDDWKISFRNEHKYPYDRLWIVQLDRDKIIEALSSAERGRAQALMDLLKSKFDMELDQSSCSAEDTEAVYDISRYLPSQTVFLAIYFNSIFFWVLEKGKEMRLRKTILDGNKFQEEGIVFLQSWIEKVSEKLRSVKCEDRCLDGSADDKVPVQSSQETASIGGKKEALKELYNAFIGPIADLLHGDEIAIVPDGPLALLPFAAVVDQHSRYLSETFRIRLIPSLTSLKLMAECPEGYHSKTGALLVGDPRVAVKVVINGKCTELPPLPWAKKEVEMIGAILNTKPLTGESATKTAVLSRISSVALVHIAAHGLPETGEIILSPDPASSSGDFLLKMKDILDSNLRAQLVVLSCCHTGRGQIKAEGVVGIARAFLGAGARSVIVTLWAIDDKATKEFMKHFYKHLSEGQLVSKCLHKARKHLRESDDFNDVSCWAPFVLIGDDVTISFNEIRMTATGEEASFDSSCDV